MQVFLMLRLPSRFRQAQYLPINYSLSGGSSPNVSGTGYNQSIYGNRPDGHTYAYTYSATGCWVCRHCIHWYQCCYRHGYNNSGYLCGASTVQQPLRWQEVVAATCSRNLIPLTAALQPYTTNPVHHYRVNSRQSYHQGYPGFGKPLHPILW